jgi:phage terminase large subunit-like protein
LQTVFVGTPLAADEPGQTATVSQMAKIDGGMILIPREAAWLRAFKHELLAFPNGKYDD